MTEQLESIVVPSASVAQYCVIWLHGLGADGNDFEPVIPSLGLRHRDSVRFIFPHAPQRAITINGGMVMRGWYDITGMEIVRDEDAKGVTESAALVAELIEAQIEDGIDPENIILAGFSQGGAIALHVGLRYPKRLGGIIALSTYLPMADSLQGEASEANRDIPMYMAHGLYDPVLPLPLGEASRERLGRLGYTVDWHTYPMPHSVLPQQLIDIGRFINNTLQRNAPAR
jgi:phospholipase/carboxylesterase